MNKFYKYRYLTNNTNTRLCDITWPPGQEQPRTLVAFNEIKGKWTYPKPGFIQWKNEI